MNKLQKILAVLAIQKKTLVVFLCFFVPIMAFFDSARAEHKSASSMPPHIASLGIDSLSGDFNRTDIEAAFLRSVLSPSGLDVGPQQSVFPYVYSASPSLMSFFQSTNFKDSYPWLYEFLYREKGMPRAYSLNKWNGDVNVSFGLPYDLKSKNINTISADFYLQPSYSVGSMSREILDVLLENFNQKLPILSELTGLSVTYQEINSDIPEPEGGIRIVIVDSIDDWKTAYKKGPVSTLRHVTAVGPKPLLFRDRVEAYFYSAIPFTRSSDSQVDGYFLTNESNEIEMSVCYIWKSHKTSVIKALVNECLIRSLGLPGEQNIAGGGFLSLWNKSNESKKVDFKSLDHLPEDFSDFDKAFIAELYRPEFLPGMSLGQVIDVLKK